jgi:hypothetical protein
MVQLWLKVLDSAVEEINRESEPAHAAHSKRSAHSSREAAAPLKPEPDAAICCEPQPAHDRAQECAPARR